MIIAGSAAPSMIAQGGTAEVWGKGCDRTTKARIPPTRSQHDTLTDVQLAHSVAQEGMLLRQGAGDVTELRRQGYLRARS